MPVLSGGMNFAPFEITYEIKMVKNLHCLKTFQICYLRHAEHHAKNRTSLCGRDQETLFFTDPRYLSIRLYLQILVH